MARSLSRPFDRINSGFTMLSILKDWRIVTPTVIFCGLLIYGFLLANEEVYKGITTGDRSFLQNLLSEGVGVFFSVVMIAPLTAYVVEQRRQNRLKPLQVKFLKQIASKIDYTSRQYLSHFSNFSSLKYTLELLDLNDALNKFSHLTNLSRQGVEYTREDNQGKMISAAKAMGGTLDSIDRLRYELSGIEKNIDLASTFMPEEIVSDISDISFYIDRELANFRDLNDYLSGTASPEQRIRALNTRLDMSEVIRKFDAVLDRLGHADIKASIKNGRSATIEMHQQRSIIQGIGKIIDKIHYQDAL